MITWRGWGVSVGLLFVFWFFAAGISVAASGLYISDKHKAAMAIQWGMAAFVGLYALSVLIVVAIRRKNPARVALDGAPPRPILFTDHFMHVPLVHWPAIILAGAAFVAGVTALGYSLFGS